MSNIRFVVSGDRDAIKDLSELSPLLLQKKVSNEELERWRPLAGRIAKEVDFELKNEFDHPIEDVCLTTQDLFQEAWMACLILLQQGKYPTRIRVYWKVKDHIRSLHVYRKRQTDAQGIHEGEPGYGSEGFIIESFS